MGESNEDASSYPFAGVPRPSGFRREKRKCSEPQDRRRRTQEGETCALQT